jgi:hypothetical protein
MYFIGTAQPHMPAADGPSEETTFYTRDEKREMTEASLAAAYLLSLDSSDGNETHRIAPFATKLKALRASIPPEVLVCAVQLLNTLPTDFLASVAIESGPDGLIFSWPDRHIYCHVLDARALTSDDNIHDPNAQLYVCAICSSAGNFNPQYCLRVVDALAALIHAASQ